MLGRSFLPRPEVTCRQTTPNGRDASLGENGRPQIRGVHTIVVEGLRQKAANRRRYTMEMNPSGKSDAELIRMFAPLVGLPAQIRVH